MPPVVLSSDLLQRGQPRLVGLFPPVSKIARLLFEGDLSYYFPHRRASLCSSRSIFILPFRHLPGIKQVVELIL